MTRRLCVSVDDDLFIEIKQLSAMKYRFEKGFQQKFVIEALENYVKEQKDENQKN